MLSIAETFLFKYAVLGRRDYVNILFLLISKTDDLAAVEIYFDGLLKSYLFGTSKGLAELLRSSSLCYISPFYSIGARGKPARSWRRTFVNRESVRIVLLGSTLYRVFKVSFKFRILLFPYLI